MDKAADAFRTISEVSELLDTPAHVLRFWESRFPQIRPVKRAGGRRYYRPTDLALLIGIKRLLHDEGLTIRGVQKILREQGVRHVAGVGDDALFDETDQDAEAALEQALKLNFGSVDSVEEAELEPEKAESATIVALETALRRQPTVARTDRSQTSFGTASLFEQLDHPAPDTPAASPATEAPKDLPEQVPDQVIVAPAPPVIAAPVAITPPEAAVMAAPAFVPDEPVQEPLAPKPDLWPKDADLLTKLHALPPFALHGNLARARSLHGRMIGLRSRMLAPPHMADHQR